MTLICQCPLLDDLSPEQINQEIRRHIDRLGAARAIVVLIVEFGYDPQCTKIHRPYQLDQVTGLPPLTVIIPATEFVFSWTALMPSYI